MYGYNGAWAPYDLNVTLSTAPSDDRYEPNDARENATPVSEGTYSDLQIVGHDDDYFAITLDESGSIDASVDFAHSESDLDLRLYGPDGELLDESYSITDEESVSVAGVESGTYYARVYSYNGESAPYDLTISTETNQSPVTAVALESSGDSIVAPGEKATVTITATNSGNQAISSGGLQLTVPEPLTVSEVSGDGSNRPDRFFVQPIEPGDSVSTTYVFSADANASSQTVSVDVSGQFRTSDARVSNSLSVQIDISDELGEGLPTQPGEPTFLDVLGVIEAYNTNTAFNGVDVGFQDVLDIIEAYNLG